MSMAMTVARTPADECAGADPGALDREKKRLRRTAKTRRAAAAGDNPNAHQALARVVLGAVDFQTGDAVSGYWPLGDEIDPRPLLEALHERGHPIGLPAMPGEAQPLTFRAWQPGAELMDGGFGTRVPPESSPVIVPRVLLVPMLAFDRAGYRLGYGGGFYDRTLAQLRADQPDTLAVGVAYQAQEVDRVPRGRYDQRLDMVLTEQGPVALDAADPLDPREAPDEGAD
jgi:5-formyltetrahydrofolate cyclo-ligase